MLSGVAIGEAAIAAGAGFVTGSGAFLAESITEPISASDSGTSLTILVGALVEAFAADGSTSASGAAIGDAVFDALEMSALFLVDGLWVTGAAVPLEWSLAPATPGDWAVVAEPADFWIKQ